MLPYYKSRTEITKEFGVSEGAIRKWIKKTLNKELNLELQEIEGKFYISKSDHNRSLLKEQAQISRKYKSSEDKIILYPSKTFYQIFSKEQIIALSNSIEADRTIPNKYSYFDVGADYWESFYNKTLKNGSFIASKSDLYYFENAYNLIKDNFGNKKINVVDIGSGNAESVLPFVQRLEQESLLNSFTAEDYSASMIKYAQKHTEHYKLNSKVFYDVSDFETTSLQKLLFHIKFTTADQCPTLITCLGGSLFNQPDILHSFLNIKDGMLPEDKLLVTNSLRRDDEYPTRFFAYSDPESFQTIIWLPELLGIKKDLYEFNQTFVKSTGFLHAQLVLKKDIDIVFTELNNHTIHLYKHEPIVISQHKRDTYTSISDTARNLKMRLNLIVKHPTSDHVMYMMGKR